MSRELCLKLLADPAVQKLSVMLSKKPEYISTKAVEYSRALSSALADIDDEDIVAVSHGVLPGAFCQYINKGITGEAVAERIVKYAADIVESVLFAEAELDELDRERKEAEAEAARIAAAESEALKNQEEIERLAADAARREAEAVKEAARKAEVARIVEQKERLAAEANARKAADESALAEADKKKAESDVSGDSEDGSMTASELESLPVDKSGLPNGIVTDLVKGRVNTVGQLMMLGEAQDGDFSIITGIGDVSSRKINDRIAVLKSLVKE